MAHGYDGSSNMCGELDGLKIPILMENESANYVSCFANKLQLTVVAVANISKFVFLSLIASVFIVARASCKHCDKLREHQAAEVMEVLNNGEVSSKLV